MQVIPFYVCRLFLRVLKAFDHRWEGHQDFRERRPLKGIHPWIKWSMKIYTVHFKVYFAISHAPCTSQIYRMVKKVEKVGSFDLLIVKGLRCKLRLSKNLKASRNCRQETVPAIKGKTSFFSGSRSFIISIRLPERSPVISGFFSRIDHLSWHRLATYGFSASWLSGGWVRLFFVSAGCEFFGTS